MPTIITHAVSGAAIGSFGAFRGQSLKFWAACAFCAALPDIDVLGFYAGIPYHSVWGHRGFTHSITFALLTGFVLAFFFHRKQHFSLLRFSGYFLLFSLCTLSHGIFDAMTNGGYGIAFFAPFSENRYFFPVRPVAVSPLSLERFFSERGLEVLKSEFIYITGPSLVVLYFTRMVRLFFFRKID